MNARLPAGFRTANPYLIVTGAAQAISFMQAVFDAVATLRIDRPDGRVAHAALRIGDSMIELSEAHGDWRPMPGSIHLYVSDVDATYSRALQAGAVALAEPSDKFYGERNASVRDPVGNLWHIATLIEALPPDEILRRSAEAYRIKSDQQAKERLDG